MCTYRILNRAQRTKKNVPLLIHTPTPCRSTRPLSIHLLCCQYARPLSIHPPPVNTPAPCRSTCPLSIHTPASCQYACPVVDMPALLSICLPCGRYTHLLSIHLQPYWCTCVPIDTPALAVVVVGHGAADDVAGSMDAHIPQGGKGQEMTLRWWWWSTCLAWCEVHICQLHPGWNLWMVGGTMAVSSHRWQGLL